MTDKDEIKFAIRYLKQGLKSKRTPPLYEELMKELGFERKDKAEKLKHFLALWENAVDEIRAENIASRANARIAYLCDKLESSMVAYSHGNIEYAQLQCCKE